MSDVLLFFRRLALTALTAAAMTAMAPPAGAACPPASRIFAVEPGRTWTPISKTILLSGLGGAEIGWTVPPSFGTLEDAGDSYLYRPNPSFWTAGFDSFLLYLPSHRRGESRVETVLLLPALARSGHLNQDFEDGTPAWVPSGQAENLEIFSAETISGAHSLRAQGIPGQPSWITGSLTPLPPPEPPSIKPGEGDTGGGQQGSGAQATLRPPGLGGPGNLQPMPSLENPVEMVFLNLGTDGSSEYKVRARDDGEQMYLRLQGPGSFTPWIPVWRGPHRIQLVQWNGEESCNRRLGVSLWIDGALAASLTWPTDSETSHIGQRLKVGSVEIGGSNPMELELDDFTVFYVQMNPGSSCRMADGFETGQLDSSWVNGGNLAATPTAALQGSGGLAVPLGAGFSPAGAMLEAFLPEEEDHRLGVRFRFDPHGVSIPSGGRLQLFQAVSTNEQAFALFLEPAASGYRLTLQGSLNFASTSAPIPIPNLPQEITLDWQRSASSNVALGTLRLWIGGELKAALTGLNNDHLELTKIRLGALAVSGSGDALGTVYLDEFLAVRGPRP